MILWRAISDAVARLFSPGELLFASAPAPAAPDYSAINALSALARFSAVWQCCDILSTDIASRPLRSLRRSSRRAKPTEVDDPALAWLEERPNAGYTAFEFRQLTAIDWLLAGNAYIWRPSGPAIYRLHPSEVEPLVGPLGIASGYRWTETISGTERILPPDEVIHVRNMQWNIGLQAGLGESSVRALHDAFTTEIGARKTAKEAASRGRPDLLFSLDQALGPNVGKQLIAQWQEAMARRDGAFVLGQGAKATQLSWSPSEMNETARVNDLRQEVFASMGVPMSRAGYGGDANYATARQEEKTYWERLRSRVRVFEDGYSRLAQPGARIVHSFDDVEALHVARSERIANTEAWVRLGASPKEAAAYEGFEDSPAGDEPRQAAMAPQDPANDGGSSASSDGEEDPNEPAERAILSAVARAVSTLREVRAAADGADLGLVYRWQSAQLRQALESAGLHDEGRTADGVLDTLRTAHEMGLDLEPWQISARLVRALRGAS